MNEPDTKKLDQLIGELQEAIRYARRVKKNNWADRCDKLDCLIWLYRSSNAAAKLARDVFTERFQPA